MKNHGLLQNACFMICLFLFIIGNWSLRDLNELGLRVLSMKRNMYFLPKYYLFHGVTHTITKLHKFLVLFIFGMVCLHSFLTEQKFARKISIRLLKLGINIMCSKLYDQEVIRCHQ